MSARLSRAELAVLVDEIIDAIDVWSVEKMIPEDAFNLGLIAGHINAIDIGLHG